MFNCVVYGYFDGGLNSQSTWQCDYLEGDDSKGRGYPDWIPENSTLLPPPKLNSVFASGKWS